MKKFVSTLTSSNTSAFFVLLFIYIIRVHNVLYRVSPFGPQFRLGPSRSRAREIYGGATTTRVLCPSTFLINTRVQIP